jgi:hypothetical protein
MPKRRGDKTARSAEQRTPEVPPPERQGRTDDADAFMRDPGEGPARIGDDLAETLAEEFLHAATSGEDMADEVLEQVVPEEIGGPFVETTGDQEFADGTDESNPVDATPEPLPRAVSGLARRPEEE